MKAVLVFIAILFCTSTLRAQVVESDDLGSTHLKERRSTLKSRLPAGAVSVLFSGGLRASGLSSPVPEAFQANPDFFYLTGLNLPHSVLVLFPQAIPLKEGSASEILFLPDMKQLPLNSMGFGYPGEFGVRNPDLIVRPISQWRKFCLEILDADQTERIWTLPTGPSDFYVFRENYQFQPPLTEFYNILSPSFQTDPEVSQLYKAILRADSSKLEATQREVKSWLGYFGKQPDPILKKFLAVERIGELEAVQRSIRDIKIDYGSLETLLFGMRLVKSKAELEALRQAAAIAKTCMVQGAAQVKSGGTEGEVAGAILAEMLARGARPARSIQVIGEEPASNYLYAQNNRPFASGGALVVDLSVRKDAYCAHVTRTFPLASVFEPAYVDLYAATESIHRAVLAACKPGAGPNALCQQQKESLFAKLDGKVLANEQRRTWRDEYATVSVYPIGLDLFECQNPQALKAGMVFEVETLVAVPASKKYKEEYWGKSVRLRDVVAVTAGEPEILTGNLPFRMVEVETMVGWEK